MNAELVTRSFEIAAERAGDITPLVYDKLFARFPETEALFSSNKSARGEMWRASSTSFSISWGRAAIPAP